MKGVPSRMYNTTCMDGQDQQNGETVSVASFSMWMQPQRASRHLQHADTASTHPSQQPGQPTLGFQVAARRSNAACGSPGKPLSVPSELLMVSLPIGDHSMPLHPGSASQAACSSCGRWQAGHSAAFTLMQAVHKRCAIVHFWNKLAKREFCHACLAACR